jgi:signal peptidase I
VTIHDDPRRRILRLAITLAETVVATLIVFVLLQTFVGRTYAVEQTSMEPTLEPAQRLLIDRLTPRFDPYKPGDIIVFEPPARIDVPAPLIKRVIAIGGSTVELIDGRVVVDGVALDEPYTFEAEPTIQTTDQTRWRVPGGQLFVLGDHRAVSVDSRTFGPIEVSSVIGRAWLRFLPLEDAALLTAQRTAPSNPASGD